MTSVSTARAVGLVVLLTLVNGAARAQPREPDLARQAAQLQAELRRRGEHTGEIHLALAAFYTRRGGSPQTIFRHLRAARSLEIARSRIDLVLAEAYRRQRRYDAALTTLVRLLVQNARQPHALLQLWRTLYEAQLRQVETKTDTGAIRERLAASGMHLPNKIDTARDATARSKKLTAAGYNALLAKRNRFAAELFEAAIDALPVNARAHRGLGIARARQSDFARASGAYLLYLDLAPNAPDADKVDRILIRYWRGLKE